MIESVLCSVLAAVAIIIHQGIEQTGQLIIVVAVGIGFSVVGDERREIVGRFGVIRWVSKLISFYVLQLCLQFIWTEMRNTVESVVHDIGASISISSNDWIDWTIGIIFDSTAVIGLIAALVMTGCAEAVIMTCLDLLTMLIDVVQFMRH